MPVDPAPGPLEAQATSHRRLIAVREHMEGLIVQDASAGPDRLAGMAAQLDQAQALVSACMFADKRAKEDQPAA